MTTTARTLLAGFLLSFLAGSAAPAQTKEEHLQEKLVMRSVALFLERAHLSGQSLDDEMARRAFKSYFESLDPLKLYFYKADIDEFQRRADELDDMLKDGKPEFALDVFKRFLERIGERVTTVEQLLAGKFDFTLDEQFVTDGDTAKYPTTKEEARNRWRRRMKYDLLALKADKVDEKEGRERLLKRYRRFRERVGKETREEIISRFVNALATSFDPHTIYMAPKPFEDFEMGITLNYQGIGALLGEEDGYVVVRRVLPGGSAEKQGRLKPKDRIVAVGQGREGEMTDVVGMRLPDVVKLIRGDEGTVVRLAIVPTAGGASQIHTLIRSKIELEESAAKGEIIEHAKGADGKPFRIGVIDLPSFYRDTNAQGEGKKDFRTSTGDVRRILEDFTAKKVSGVVLDLRRNGGGYLPEAVGIAGLFIDRGTVVQVRGGGRRVRTLDDDDPGMAWEGPLVVLVSRASASASEIVAGAIKDYRRGLLVGDTATHGKGTVQSPVDLAAQLDTRAGSLGFLKLTLQQFYRPNGDSTQRRGVPTDVAIPSWTNVMDIGESELPFAMPFTKVDSARFSALDHVDDKILKQVRDSAAARRATSEYFQTLDKRLAAYARLKDRKSIPLNEKAYMKLQAELDARDEAADEAGKVANALPSDPDEPKRSQWFNEVLDITTDYVRALAKRRV